MVYKDDWVIGETFTVDKNAIERANKGWEIIKRDLDITTYETPNGDTFTTIRDKRCSTNDTKE